MNTSTLVALITAVCVVPVLSLYWILPAVL